jgi:hypothetical protein
MKLQNGFYIITANHSAKEDSVSCSFNEKRDIPLAIYY